jgi:hypothetical protein
MTGITDEMIGKATEILNRAHTYLSTRDLAEEIITTLLAGRTVLDLPEPTAWRNRMDGDVDIWPVGGWSVTASPSGVEICTSRDGLGGGGLTFRAEQAREFGTAILAADARLAARWSSGVAGDAR